MSEADILNALGRVLGASRLDPKSNPARLLTYVVTETLEQRHDRIKALTIAQDVLGRGRDFDPSKDSIVRVEMKRLRDVLDHYYSTLGADDPIHISIPKGSYIPVFQPTAPPEPPVQAPPPEPFAPALQSPVAPQARHTPRWMALGALILALGIAIYLLWPRLFPDPGLGQPEVRIVTPAGWQGNAHAVASQTLSRFHNVTMLEPATGGGIPQEEDYRIHFRNAGGDITVLLIHSDSREMIDSVLFKVDDIGNLSNPQQATALRLWLSRVFANEGVVESDFIRRGDYGGDFRCSVLTDAYFRVQSADTHLAARSCIQSRLDKGRQSARLYTDLALLHRDEHAKGFNPLDGPALDRANAAARTAISRDRHDARAYYTLMTVLFAMGAIDEAIEAGETSLELNPFNGEALGRFATRMNFSGQHEKALELFDRSRPLMPGAINWRDHGYFLAHLGLGNLDQAASSGIALAGSNRPLYLVAIAISAQIRGETQLAIETKARLPVDRDALHDMYTLRSYNPALIEKILGHLDAIPAP